MKRRKSIQIKASFLMIVFSLNTLIGFACALGIDMGFNSSHHHDGELTQAVVHIHKDGKKHVHAEEVKPQDESVNDHHKKDGKDNCCDDKVTQFSQLDKVIPQSLSVISPTFFTSFVAAFYNTKKTFLSQGFPGLKYFVRSHHPPIPDIRIAVQSFQI